MKERLTIEPGQKFRHKRKGVIYIVNSVKDETVLLISENGEGSMRIQKEDFLASAEFELVQD